MPEEPKDMKKRMQNFTKRNVPHFFIYAKEKEDVQVEGITNSLVNKFDSLIPSPNISIRDIRDGKSKKIGKADYRLLMRNPDLKISGSSEKHPVIAKYNELAKTYSYKLNDISENCAFPAEIMIKSKVREHLLYHSIVEEVTTALSQLGYSDIEITDILVKYLYCEKKNSDRKNLLWICYGSFILENLKANREQCDYSKDVQCIDCGEWFYVTKKDNNTCRCPECQIEHKKELKRLEMQRYRARKRQKK